VALGSHWGGFEVALRWLSGAYRLATNTLSGGSDVALMWPSAGLTCLSSFFILTSAFIGRSGVGLVRVWGRSGGGLTWLTQSCDIEQLMKLAMWPWVSLCAACIDGEATDVKRFGGFRVR